MRRDLDYRYIDDYAKGVYLSDAFKSANRDLPEISEHGEADIYFEELDEIYSDYWLFAMTVVSDYPNPLMMPLSSLDEAFDENESRIYEFNNGFIRKIHRGEHDGKSEPTFILGLLYPEQKTMETATKDASVISDVFISGLLLESDLTGGLKAINHSARALTQDEFNDAKAGKLNLVRIINSLPLKELAGNVSHIVEDGIKIEFEFIEKTFDFLNSVKLESKHQKVKTACGLTIDGIKARTKEQGYLTLYTALNYLIEDIGRQSRSAKSEAQMALKLADESVISTQKGKDLIEELNGIHEIRSDILWGAETISKQDYSMVREFLQRFFLLYYDYWHIASGDG